MGNFVRVVELSSPIVKWTGLNLTEIEDYLTGLMNTVLDSVVDNSGVLRIDFTPAPGPEQQYIEVPTGDYVYTSPDFVAHWTSEKVNGGGFFVLPEGDA